MKHWIEMLLDSGRRWPWLGLPLWLGCAFLGATVLSQLADAQSGPPAGQVDETFDPQIQSRLTAIAVRPDGKIWIAGDFFQVGGVRQIALARLNSDGTFDTNFTNNYGAQGMTAIAPTPDGGVIAAAYTFWKPGSTVRTNLARFLANGEIDESFDAGSGPNFGVNSIVVQGDGKILLAGYFSQVNGIARGPLARLEANGEVDQAFDVRLDGLIHQIVLLSGGQILIGGDFRTVNGVPRKAVARLFSNGALDPTFAPDLGIKQTIPFVQALAAMPDGTILIGGGFDFINGVPRKNIARLTSAGQLDSRFELREGPNSWVRRLAVQADGKILASGPFDRFDNLPLRLVRLMQNGCLDVGFQPRVEVSSSVDFVQALAVQPNGGILAVGSFQTAAGINRSGLVRLGGGESGPMLPIISTQPQSHSVAAGGSVTLVSDAVSCAPLSFQWQHARTNRPGAVAASLSLTNVSFADAGDYQVLVSNAAGSTTSAVAVITVVPARPGLGDPAFEPDAFLGGGVSALARQSDGMILIGGTFTNVGGVNRAGITRLDPNGRVDPAFAGPGIDSGTGRSVSIILVQDDGKILIGGSFGTVQGVARRGIARLRVDGTVDESFDAGTGPAGEVFSIIPSAGGKLYVGGKFLRWNEQPSSGIVRLNDSGSVDLRFTSPLAPPYGCLMCTIYIHVAALVGDANGSILAGGEFTLFPASGISERSLVALGADGGVNPDFRSGIGFVDSLSPGFVPKIYVMLRQPDEKLIVAGFFNRFGAASRNWLGRLNPNGSLDSSFDVSEDFVPDGFASANSTVIQAVALQPDGKILIAGQFDRIDGAPRKNLARLNTNGRIDLTFDAGIGPDGPIKTLLFEPGGTLLVGGDFRTFNGSPRAGLVRVQANPNIPGPPSIIVPPGRLLIQTSHAAAFNVFATGSNLRYQWTRNGIAMPGETNEFLFVPSVSSALRGPYTVTVHNDLGSVTSPATEIRDLDIAEALDTPGLPWTSGGTPPWQIVKSETHDGEDALAAAVESWGSGAKPPWIETTLEGPGKLTYWVRRIVTAGFGTFLYLDGSSQLPETGGWTGWISRTNAIPPGRHTVRLELQNSGPVYLDQVRFTPDLPTDIQPRLVAERAGADILLSWPQSGNSFVLQMSGELSSSTDWRTVTTTPTLNGARYEVRVPPAAGRSFYRLRER